MKITRLSVTTFLIASIIGCATIDSNSVKARPGAPESARVDRLEIPYDSSLPRFALMVQTFVKEGPVNETIVNTHLRSELNGTVNQNSKTNTSERAHDEHSVHAVNAEMHKSNERNEVNPQIPTAKKGKTSSPLKQVANGKVNRDAHAEGMQGTLEREDYHSHRDQVATEVEDSHEKTNIGLNSHVDSSYERRDRTWEVSRRDINIAAQFTSSLAGVKNFVVLDPAAVSSKGSGIYAASLPSGSTGPFIVKAIVSEELYEVEGSRRKLILPGIIATKTSMVQGVVVLDVTVTDGRTGAIVAAFPTEGTFSSQDKRFSAGILLPFSEQHAFARSVVSQAQRVALNQAARKIFDALSDRASQ